MKKLITLSLFLIANNSYGMTGAGSGAGTDTTSRESLSTRAPYRLFLKDYKEELKKLSMKDKDSVEYKQKLNESIAGDMILTMATSGEDDRLHVDRNHLGWFIFLNYKPADRVPTRGLPKDVTKYGLVELLRNNPLLLSKLANVCGQDSTIILAPNHYKK